MDQMKQEDKDYEEILRLLEEEADNWLLENSADDEFEDLDDPNKPFRTEYAFEGLTQKGSRYKKWNAD